MKLSVRSTELPDLSQNSLKSINDWSRAIGKYLDFGVTGYKGQRFWKILDVHLNMDNMEASTIITYHEKTRDSSSVDMKFLYSMVRAVIVDKPIPTPTLR
jgi:hypothetical protein